MKFLSFLIIVLLPHLNAQPDSTKWKQYSRIGSVSVDSTSGVFGFFRLNRKTLILTNLTISPRKQECVVVTFEDLIERAKAHLIELQKGNKI